MHPGKSLKHSPQIPIFFGFFNTCFGIQHLQYICVLSFEPHGSSVPSQHSVKRWCDLLLFVVMLGS